MGKGHERRGIEGKMKCEKVKGNKGRERKEGGVRREEFKEGK